MYIFHLKTVMTETRLELNQSTLRHINSESLFPVQLVKPLLFSFNFLHGLCYKDNWICSAYVSIYKAQLCVDIYINETKLAVIVYSVCTKLLIHTMFCQTILFCDIVEIYSY